MQSDAMPAKPVPVRGAKKIGEVIERTPTQTWYLLEKGLLPAKKVGGIWQSELGVIAG